MNINLKTIIKKSNSLNDVCANLNINTINQYNNVKKTKNELINEIKQIAGTKIQLSNYILLDNIYLHNATRLKTNKANINILDNFLSYNECNELINYILKNNEQSKVIDKTSINSNRTSKTSYLSNNIKIANLINNKICNYMGINNNNSEIMQGQYYNINCEYKPHYDTEDYNDESKWNLFNDNNLGQRTWTFMIYLNDVEEGGETIFPNLDIKIKPKKGMAIIWNNLDSHGNRNMHTLHGGCKVIKGQKFIITKWFRTNNLLKYPNI